MHRPLGSLFGFGGFAGVCLGARAQKYMSQKAIKVIIGSTIRFLAGKYTIRYFRQQPLHLATACAGYRNACRYCSRGSIVKEM